MNLGMVFSGKGSGIDVLYVFAVVYFHVNAVTLLFVLMSRQPF